MARYGMVIDLSRCMGCRACMEACKAENGTPQSSFWMYVFRLEENEYPETDVRFLPRPCMHCENPPCVAVCPYDARIKWKNGIVVTDIDKCRGTRSCEKHCPYGVNYFNITDPAKNQYLDWEDSNLKDVSANFIPAYWNPEIDKKYTWDFDPKKRERKIAGGGHRQYVVEKCTFCIHRVEKGLKPACVANCPVSALHFGDLDDAGSDVFRILTERGHEAFRLKESVGTSPKVYYLGKYPDENSRLIEIVPVKENVQLLGEAELEGIIIPWK